MLKLVFFKSKGVVSKAIQWQTRSPYSHVAIMIGDTMYESYHIGGVRKDRKPEPDCDSYYLRAQVNEGAVQAFLEEQLGKKYDFRSVLRFVTRVSANVNDKWFCSELVMAAVQAGGVRMLNADFHNVSPRDLHMTPFRYAEPTS